MSSIFAAIVVVTNIGFTAGYDTVARNPAWVSYDLEPAEVVRMKRVQHDFRADPRVAESDVGGFYRLHGKVYDRGHLAPAADFNWSTNALKETYLFTNVAPMTRKLNRGAWLDAENEVRRLAASGTVHVVMFPTYEKLTEKNFPGDMQSVVVPSGFVKIAWGWFGVREWRLENEE